MGQGITPGAQPSSNGQKEMEEFCEDGVGHLRGVRAVSPLCLMMMMMMMMMIKNCLHYNAPSL